MNAMQNRTPRCRGAGGSLRLELISADHRVVIGAEQVLHGDGGGPAVRGA
ncbi:hypothetical protein [Nonomuraea sp. NPDC049400]